MSLQAIMRANPGTFVAPPKTVSAYCGSDGVIQFGEATPSGFTEIVRGPEYKARRQLTIVARHAFEGSRLYVPGMQEATDYQTAMAALHRFIDYASEDHGLMDRVLVWNRDCKVTA